MDAARLRQLYDFVNIWILLHRLELMLEIIIINYFHRSYSSQLYLVSVIADGRTKRLTTCTTFSIAFSWIKICVCLKFHWNWLTWIQSIIRQHLITGDKPLEGQMLTKMFDAILRQWDTCVINKSLRGLKSYEAKNTKSRKFNYKTNSIM